MLKVLIPHLNNLKTFKIIIKMHVQLYISGDREKGIILKLNYRHLSGQIDLFTLCLKTWFYKQSDFMVS